jgi:hypothetical protein
MKIHPALLLFFALGIFSSTSCNQLNQLQKQYMGGAKLSPPSVTYMGATLAHAPNQRLMAAYYCPDVVSVPLGGAGLLCQGFFGRRPQPAEMSVSFDLLFRVANPNKVPIPLASVLTAATLYPGVTNQKLGAICVQLCPEGQPCTGRASADACRASNRDVRSLQDFGGAAANFLFASGIAAATGQPIGFTAPKVSSAAQLDVKVRFTFGPNELLAVMRQLAVQSVNQLKGGQKPNFTIPYKLEGTVWFDLGSFGRAAVGFGPASGVWNLPV